MKRTILAQEGRNRMQARNTHMLHMSDALSDGIIRQFPQKF
jgi:hypothetical protein